VREQSELLSPCHALPVGRRRAGSAMPCMCAGSSNQPFIYGDSHAPGYEGAARCAEPVRRCVVRQRETNAAQILNSTARISDPKRTQVLQWYSAAGAYAARQTCLRATLSVAENVRRQRHCRSSLFNGSAAVQHSFSMNKPATNPTMRGYRQRRTISPQPTYHNAEQLTKRQNLKTCR